MEHTEIGKVVSVSGSTVEVRINPTEDCGTCGARSSCHEKSGNSKERFVTASDPFGLKTGQWVKINLEPKNLVKASIILFILPLLGLLFGALTGLLIAQTAGYNNDISAVTGGFTGIGISVLGLRVYNKKLEKSNEYYPSVVEIMKV